jgi:hypothetical protein
LRHLKKGGEMGKAPRQVFESDFSAEANYQRLMEIYQQAQDAEEWNVGIEECWNNN